MKKIKVTITQEFELPDHCSIVEGAGTKMIKYNNLYLHPSIEFRQSEKFPNKEMRFIELDEDTMDIIVGALALEKKRNN